MNLEYKDCCKDITSCYRPVGRGGAGGGRNARLCREENCRYKDIVVAFPDYSVYAGIVGNLKLGIYRFFRPDGQVMKKPAWRQ